MSETSTRPSVAFAAFAVMAVLPLFLSDWIVFLIALALAKGAVVLGVVLLLRGGLISFGHALYFAIGAYTVGFLTNRFNIGEVLVALPLATIISTLVAAAPVFALALSRDLFCDVEPWAIDDPLLGADQVL
jgi:branched-chain amino acid transport system permease protein